MNDDRTDRLRQSIPLRFRILAAVLHAIFAVPMGLNVGFYSWIVFIEGGSMSSTQSLLMTVVFYFFFISLPMILFLPIISWVIWQITKQIDPFVNLAGRDVLNYALSNLAAILALTIIFFVVSGALYKLKYFEEVSFAILILVIAVFVMISVIAGIFALRGYRFNNILIYPFLQD
jgi:uncharacterized Tic20 family protein